MSTVLLTGASGFVGSHLLPSIIGRRTWTSVPSSIARRAPGASSRGWDRGSGRA